MTRPRVATVLSAREWEPRFVDLARRSGLIRIVARAYEASDLERSLPLGFVVVGSEIPWVTPGFVVRLRRRGIGVIGMYPPGDIPGRTLFATGGADVVLRDDCEPERIVEAMMALRDHPEPVEDAGAVLLVTGARGAPGRSEVALALARATAPHHSTALLDLDHEAPSLGIRLGLPPGQDLRAVAHDVLASGSLPVRASRAVEEFALISGPARGGGPLAPYLLRAVVEAARRHYGVVIADTAPYSPESSLVDSSDRVVLVCEGTPTGIIRAASLVRTWTGPTPNLVLNKVDEPLDEIVRIARHALGLDPIVTIPYLPEVRRPPGHQRECPLGAAARELGDALLAS